MALPRPFFANDSLCDVLSGVASILHHAPVVCVGQENSLLDMRPSLRCLPVPPSNRRDHQPAQSSPAGEFQG